MSSSAGLRRVLDWLVLTFVCLIVGIAVTATWPTTVHTSTYQATVRLSPSLQRIGVVHAPTIFGDLDLHFRGPLPAPGIDLEPQVETSITKVLLAENPSASIGALRPSDAELDKAISAGVKVLAVKFSAGALGAAITAMFVLHAVRRREQVAHSWRRAAGVPAVAATTAVVLTASGAALTYQPDQVEAIRTSGFISVLRSNTNLMSEVQARAVEATPYVKNVLALSAALQEKFAAPIGAGAPVKLLLVSDIHGTNQYPLMKSIVQTEGITAVIDAGDLVNFGRPDEVALAGLSEGIASLGVPYLFVRGNHDASAPGDRAILETVAAIPNAIVLDPDDGDYTLATVAGLRIAGFGDPRWFGDEGKNASAAQAPAAREFQAALDALAAGTAIEGPVATVSAPVPEAPAPSETLGSEGAPQPSGTDATAPAPTDPPGAVSTDPTAAASADAATGVDIAVGHEPAAVRPITGARLRLGGHLHSARLDGNRITAGTFTGGGVAAHYVSEEDGELKGQPYAFDILSFTGGCELSSLTRYSFRDIVEGRPVYDDIRVVNGASVEDPAPAAGRVCSPTLPLTARTFSAPAPVPGSSTGTTAPSTVSATNP